MTFSRRKFGEIAEFRNGVNYVVGDQGETAKVVGVGDFQAKTELTDFDSLTEVCLKGTVTTEDELRDGDLLFVRSNGSKSLIGRCVIVRDPPRKVTFSGFTIRARIDTAVALPEYVSLLFQGGKLKRQLTMAGGGNGNISNLSQGLLSSLELDFPELATQRALIAIATQWNTAIEKTKRLIVAKEKQLNILYQLYFQPNSKLNSLWELSKASKFLRARKGKSVPSRELPLFSLTIENGITAKTDRYDREFLVKDAGEKTYKIVCPGDIVFNPANLRWGAIARSTIKHKVVVSPIYEVLEIIEENINPDFISHALTCPRQIGIFASKTEGTLIERMAVKLDTFLLTEILHPTTKNEQANIANAFNTARQEIDLLKKQADAYRRQKRGLMQKLLTGKWRVRLNQEDTC